MLSEERGKRHADYHSMKVDAHAQNVSAELAPLTEPLGLLLDRLEAIQQKAAGELTSDQVHVRDLVVELRETLR